MLLAVGVLLRQRHDVRREKFPDRLFAAYARLVERPLFVADAGDRADVDVSARADR